MQLFPTRRRVYCLYYKRLFFSSHSSASIGGHIGMARRLEDRHNSEISYLIQPESSSYLQVFTWLVWSLSQQISFTGLLHCFTSSILFYFSLSGCEEI